MQPLLRELLDLGLVDVGDNDAWYDFLDKASDKLAQHFLKNPAKAIPAILVAMDEDAGQDDPSFQHAEDVLREDWKGLRSRFKERPRPLLRILLFDALKRAAEKSAPLASALWLTSNRIFTHLKFGRERGPFARELTAYAERLERMARALENDQNSNRVPRMTSVNLPAPPKLDSQVIKDKEFLPLLFAAVGPSSPAGQPAVAQFTRSHWQSENTTNSAPNSTWPNSNNNWAWAFAPRLEEIIASAVNAGNGRLADRIALFMSQVSAVMQQTLEQQAKHVAAVSQQIQQQSNERSLVAKLRTDILWWLEALYSPTLGLSYRDLPPQLAVVTMSHDLFGVVGTCIPTPTSVVHVLGEAVNRLKETGYDRRYSLLETLKKVQEYGPRLRELVSPPTETVGRRPLLQMIETTVYQAAPSEPDLLVQTGLRGDESVSMPELAMWCFQDLQARYLCQKEDKA